MAKEDPTKHLKEDKDLKRKGKKPQQEESRITGYLSLILTEVILEITVWCIQSIANVEKVVNPRVYRSQRDFQSKSRAILL